MEVVLFFIIVTRILVLGLRGIPHDNRTHNVISNKILHKKMKSLFKELFIHLLESQRRSRKQLTKKMHSGSFVGFRVIQSSVFSVNVKSVRESYFCLCECNNADLQVGNQCFSFRNSKVSGKANFDTFCAFFTTKILFHAYNFAFFTPTFFT